MSHRKKKKQSSLVVSRSDSNKTNAMAQQEDTSQYRRQFRTVARRVFNFFRQFRTVARRVFNFFFNIKILLILPSIVLAFLAYCQIAEPDLVDEKPPIVKTGRIANISSHSARTLTEVKLCIRNRGWKAGHVEHVDIRPLKFDQPVEVEIRYIDRRQIAPFRRKILKFQFIQTIRHTGKNAFVVTLIDNTGKQIEEMICGTEVWTGKQTPPRDNIPLIPD